MSDTLHLALQNAAAVEERARERVEGLFRAHYRGMCATVRTYIHSLDAAEEIVQEVFLKVWDIACQPQPRELTRAYLYSAARNHAISVLRHERIVRTYEEGSARNVERSSVPEIEDNLIADEIATLVNEAVARMPEKRRQVFLLSRDRELTHAEIAAIMQISTKTVEHHMTAAFKSIKTALRT